MKLLTSLSECSWIDEGVTPMTLDMPSTVAHCIPPIFPCYAKIFHPIYEDLSVQDRRLTWHEDARAEPAAPRTQVDQSIQDALSGSTVVYGAAEPGSRPVRIRWAELARQLGMPFAPTLSSWSFTRRFPGGSWPKYLIGPQEGNLASVEQGALTSILHRNTNIDRCFFHFWFLATSDWKEDLLFEGSLDDASRFPDEIPSVRCTPTHWFPEGRSWLVCTDYDLTFTLVGGPEPLIHELLGHHALECVSVQPGTRVDWEADLESSIH
jgi:hypothetical protein